MKTCLIFFFCAAFYSAGAQDRISYKVNPGEKVSTILQEKGGLYQYPRFMAGEVQFRNGKFGNGLLNFNKLLGEMQYINEKGDTLSLADEKEIRFIVLNKDTFLFQDGYLQQWKMLSPKTRLAKRTVLELTNRQKIGGFGELSSASIGTTTTMSSNQGLKDMVPKEILTFSEVTTYYISDSYNRFRPLNRKNLFEQYNRKKKELEAWLQEHPVNFFKEEDVLSLTSFLQTL